MRGQRDKILDLLSRAENARSPEEIAKFFSEAPVGDLGDEAERIINLLSATIIARSSVRGRFKIRTLTTRELEVLRLLAAGMARADVAAHFRISNSSVAKLLKRSRSKIGAVTDEHAVAEALRQKLIK